MTSIINYLLCHKVIFLADNVEKIKQCIRINYTDLLFFFRRSRAVCLVNEDN